MKKSLPVLQQLAGSLVIRAGKWEMMIAEQGVPFPCKCETVQIGRRIDGRAEWWSVRKQPRR